MFFSFKVLGQQNQYGQTIISSSSGFSYHKITQYTQWQDTAYVIECDIVIENGATLSISPLVNSNRGINIYMAQGTKISIEEGALQSIGSSEKMIKFTTHNSFIPATNLNTWYGFEFDANNYINQISLTPDVYHLNSFPSEINYNIIEYTESNQPVPYCGGTYQTNAAIFLKDFNNIIIRNSTLRYNNARFLGGAICIITKYNFTTTNQNTTLISGYPVIFNNKIHDNSAARGAAICILGNGSFPAFANIEYNDFYNNFAYRSGGAIAVFKGGEVNIQNNTIYNNTAKCELSGTTPHFTGGGGILVGLNSSCEISNNFIFNNQAVFNPSSIDITGLGGGILVRLGSNVQIIKNNINNNFAKNGAGIAVYGKNPNPNGLGSPSYASIFENTIFENNADNNGGGVTIDHSSAEIKFNRFLDNNAVNGYGGGIHINSSTFDASTVNLPIEIYHNKIASNMANNAAGIYINGDISTPPVFCTNVNIINNLLYSNNSINNGAGIYFGTGYLDIKANNNTITKNFSQTNSIGNAIYIPNKYDYTKYSFVNNIFFYNGDPYDCQIFHPGIISSDFVKNDIMFLCIADPQTNFNIIPDFVSIINDDFHLLASSPLIDIGLTNVSPISNIDLDYQPRFNNNIDLGAYEYVMTYARKTNPDTLSGFDIKIFPNPTNDVLFITVGELENENFKIEILSMEGKMLYSQAFEQSKISIDLSFIKSGIYLVKITSQKQVFINKLIKN